MNFDMQPVSESSHVHSVGYDAETLTLRICFKAKDGSAGQCYDYAEVSEEKYDGLRYASSPGSYFYANIKGKHEVTKV